MNTIMHIAHRFPAVFQLTTNTQPEIKLLLNVDDTEIHLFNGVSRKLQVVHPTSGTKYINAEDFLRSQREVSEAVRLYENRIYKRPPELSDPAEFENDIA